jgi:hypothetical protein
MDLEPVPKARISGRVRSAIRLMVNEGRSRSAAAQECGITDDWLYRALEKPECKAYRASLMQALRESEASRTIARAAKLADSAQSEHVQLQANTWLAGIEGVSVVQKSESLNVHKHMIPGLTLNIFNGSAPGDDAHLIDGLAHEAGKAKQLSNLPTPVPHPSMRNAAQIAPETHGQPAKKEGRRRATRGEKS